MGKNIIPGSSSARRAGKEQAALQAKEQAELAQAEAEKKAKDKKLEQEKLQQLKGLTGGGGGLFGDNKIQPVGSAQNGEGGFPNGDDFPFGGGGRKRRKGGIFGGADQGNLG